MYQIPRQERQQILCNQDKLKPQLLTLSTQRSMQRAKLQCPLLLLNLDKHLLRNLLETLQSQSVPHCLKCNVHSNHPSKELREGKSLSARTLILTVPPPHHQDPLNR